MSEDRDPFYNPYDIVLLNRRIAMLRISLEAIRDDGLSRGDIIKTASEALEKDNEYVG